MRRGWLRKRRTQRAIIYTTENQVLEGAIESVASDGIVLFDTQVRSDSDVALAGLVFVPRDKVRFVQIP